MFARPFLKWAGGKSQLLTQYEFFYPFQNLSMAINRYVEPFIGGGAVFFNIAQRFGFKSITIGDINPELVLAYRVVQAYPLPLIQALEKLQQRYDKDTRLEYRSELYSRIRHQFNQEITDALPIILTHEHINRVAALIFLNKTCFNGLFRLNRNGQFNVPFGGYVKAVIVDRFNLMRASEILRKVIIIQGDYTTIASDVDEKTFVYLDPPYRPVSKTSSFTSYAGKPFDDPEQIRLANFYKALDQKTGAKLMLSNSDPKQVNPQDQFFETLYQDYFIHRVYASRAINSNGQKRNKISELLILNYQHEQRALACHF